MDADLRLKQFANSLFSYIYHEYNTTFELPVKLPHVFTQHQGAEFSEVEGKAVMKLCISFRAVFNGVFIKAFPQIQRSVKHFMIFLTSRCLKLCGDDLFMSFGIICAFIAELNLFCCINGCYSFLNTAPKCLTSIFNRRLNKEFYARGGWERLRLFCENFLQINGKSEELDVSTTEQINVNKHLLLSLEESSSSDSDSSSSSDSESYIDSSEIGEDAELEDSEVDPTPSELHMDSDDESESSEGSEESMDSEDSESETEESEVDAVPKPSDMPLPADSDEETESSEESDPSSMSEEDGTESESEDSQCEAAPNTEQINSLKPIMQENLSVEKKIL